MRAERWLTAVGQAAVRKRRLVLVLATVFTLVAGAAGGGGIKEL
jgi:hypothetical protein